MEFSEEGEESLQFRYEEEANCGEFFMPYHPFSLLILLSHYILLLLFDYSVDMFGALCTITPDWCGITET